MDDKTQKHETAIQSSFIEGTLLSININTTQNRVIRVMDQVQKHSAWLAISSHYIILHSLIA